MTVRRAVQSADRRPLRDAPALREKRQGSESSGTDVSSCEANRRNPVRAGRLRLMLAARVKQSIRLVKFRSDWRDFTQADCCAGAALAKALR